MCLVKEDLNSWKVKSDKPLVFVIGKYVESVRQWVYFCARKQVPVQ